MNVMEQIFEIRSCIEILTNDIKINVTDQLINKYNQLYLITNLLQITVIFRLPQSAIPQHICYSCANLHATL